MFLNSLSRIFVSAKQFLYGKFGIDTRPAMLTHMLTTACNLRCKMCSSYEIPSKNDLKMEEIERIYKSLGRLDILRITGGEPFLNKNLFKIILAAEQHLKPLFIHITSNGTYPDRVMKLCEEKGRKTKLILMFSLDGWGKRHDKIRLWSSDPKYKGPATGEDGSTFDVCLNLIKELSRRKKELNIEVCVNQTVVDEQGIIDYRLLRDHLREFGVFVQVVFAYDESATYHPERKFGHDVIVNSNIGRFTPFCKLDDVKLSAFIRELIRDSWQANFFQGYFKRVYYKMISEWLLKKDKVYAPNSPCVALSRHIRMYPNGDMPTCQFNSVPVGNLKTQSLQEIKSTSTYKTQLNWVKNCTGCAAECETTPSFVYSGDIFYGPFSVLLRNLLNKVYSRKRVTGSFENIVIPRSSISVSGIGERT